MRGLKIFSVVLMVVFLLSSCKEEDDENTITMGYVTWEEDVAMTNVAKVVLEENGYKVKFRNADINPIFENLLPRGQIDVFMDVWMPTTHKDYMAEHGADLEILGDNFTNAKTGLAVPDYVDINSIEELNDNKDKFHGRISGIDIGAGIMATTEEAIDQYDLDLELLTSTNFALMTTLEQSIKDEKWIVFTGWKPHSMFSRFDIKMLDDPENVYGDAEKIQSVAREGFSEDHPFVAEIFKNIHFDDDEMASLLKTIEKAKNEFDGAESWIEENRALVDSWIPEKDGQEASSP